MIRFNFNPIVDFLESRFGERIKQVFGLQEVAVEQDQDQVGATEEQQDNDEEHEHDFKLGFLEH